MLPLPDCFPARAGTVEMLLDGRAEAYMDFGNVMHFSTARLLTALGHGRRVLPQIASDNSACFQEPAAEIREREDLI